MSRPSIESNGSDDDGSSDSSGDLEKDDPHIEEFIGRRKGEKVVRRKRKSSSKRKTLIPGSSTSVNKKQEAHADDYDVHENSRLSATKLNILPVPDVSSHKEGNMPITTTTNLSKSSSWELWWIQSPLWRRKLVFLLFICGIMGIMQLICGIYLIFDNPGYRKRDPYICATEKCRSLSEWLNYSIVDFNNDDSSLTPTPCSNFYKFTCINHKPSDTGDLFLHWYSNFARLESDGTNGASILSNILSRPSESDIMGQRIVKFYQVCMKVWQYETLHLEESFTTLIQHVFKDFDIWGSGGKYELEKMAVKMVDLLGDFGFFKTLAPVSYPVILLENWVFTANIRSEHIAKFLPVIYNALGIVNPKNRHIISQNLYYMGGIADSLLDHGRPIECKVESISSDPDIEFDFKISYYLAYYADYSEEYTFKREIVIKLDPLESEFRLRNFETFPSQWSCSMHERFQGVHKKRYVRASYAVFWSLRLLIELVHDADDKTAEDYELTDRKNSFFSVFQRNYYGRQKESRCFQSLLDAMGFYPIFRFFLTRNPKEQHKEAMNVVKHAASALLEQFRPVEEGGLPYVSSRYRERVYRILANVDDVNVLIPIMEDDNTFTKSSTGPHLHVGDSHVDNIINWRQFTFNRTRHFWQSKSPQGKLVWYKAFYRLDRAGVYESPSAAQTPLLKIPPSIFVYPFWNNDLEVANYAGARVLAAKAWMQLVQFDYANRNVRVDIAEKKNKGILYREGVTTDADYEPCEVLTYNWYHPLDRSESFNNHHQLQTFDPHFFAFRYGSREYKEWFDETDVERGLGAFPISIAAKIMLHKFFDEIGTLRKKPVGKLPQIQRNRLLYRKLIKYDHFTEAQLFFLINFRELCRAKVLSDIYYLHTTENTVALMHMPEFASTWQCPPNSPMNPELKCFT